MDWYYALLILYFIFFAVLAVKDLQWALYVIIFSLPSYLIRFKLGWLPMTLLEGMILILFLVWLFETIKHKNIKTLKQIILKYRYLFIWSGLFLLSATMAVFVGPDLKAAAGIWKAYFIEPFLFLVVLLTSLKRENIKWVWRVLFFQVLILSLVAFYQKLTGELIPNDFWAAEATRRVTSVFGYPNALSLYLAPIITMFLGLGVRAKKQGENKWMLNYLIIVMVGLSAVYFTGSKGAWLGFLAGLVFYGLFYRSARGYFVLILILVTLIGVYAWQAGKIDLTGRATVKGGDSVSVRLMMWQESWQMLKARPWWGAGLAGYQQAVAPYHHKDYIEIYLYPHNVLLNFWSELGLAGLLAFLLIIVWFYRIGFQKSVGDYSLICMGGMTTLLVHGLVDVPYFKNDLSMLFWLVVGILLVEKMNQDREKIINRV